MTAFIKLLFLIYDAPQDTSLDLGYNRALDSEATRPVKASVANSTAIEA